jgi:predicted SnoaL-like aldol condensation-catalyzing enzyme
MRIRVAARLGVLLLLVGIAATWSVRAADDPSNGTWKLNVEKSKFDPGPAPKSSTVTITIANGTETYAGETVNADGKTTKMAFTAKLDGSDSPVTGNTMGDTIAIKHPSASKFVATLKNGGKVTVTVHVTVSADGKTRTTTYSGKNADGKDVHSVMVYDKQ